MLYTNSTSNINSELNNHLEHDIDIYIYIINMNWIEYQIIKKRIQSTYNDFHLSWKLQHDLNFDGYILDFHLIGILYKSR